MTFFSQSAGVLPSDIPVQDLPEGKWRLGVPFPNTRALLMRFAHANDLNGLMRHKQTRIMYEKVEAEEERRRRRKRHRDEEMDVDEEETRKFVKAGRRLDGGIKSRLSGESSL